ncbi:hypothetical protein EV702DRAFT_1042634 [Suillus placidus]|uniref:Uncharacterized protein n=1 Tax=Suillus placidus TaxID=48579 RepID=A0A9P7A3T9_9AGAM|nr:hypothetical protein EV702DRAFT_1042634 [Suillus placidus]
MSSFCSSGLERRRLIASNRRNWPGDLGCARQGYLVQLDESVQVRLVQENKTLSVEWSHLADIMVNGQRMHGDLERSGENDRRRLENQIQAMHDQTLIDYHREDMKAQLSQKRDAVRYVTLHKDINLKDLQTHLDKTLSQAWESLVDAETSKVHLQERVNQLTRQLQGNEEKLAVYERRPSVDNGASPATEQDLPCEKQLELEVTDSLRSALKVTQVDLTAARSHMQQFQEISQANEAALTALNVTHDQYKTETEAQISKNELEYKALQDKLRSIEDVVQQSADKFSKLQRTFELERLVWTNDKKTLEDTIVDLSTSEKTSETVTGLLMRVKFSFQAAEDRYSCELIVHAESIKTIGTPHTPRPAPWSALRLSSSSQSAKGVLHGLLTTHFSLCCPSTLAEDPLLDNLTDALPVIAFVRKY